MVGSLRTVLAELVRRIIVVANNSQDETFTLFRGRLHVTAFTNVGTTYKLIRRASLERLPLLIPPIDMELNAHFLDTVGLCFGWRSR